MRQKHDKFTALLLPLCLVLTMLPITALAQNAWSGTGLAEMAYSSNAASLYAMGNNIVIQAAGDATTNLYYADVDGDPTSAAINLSGLTAIEGGASDISGNTTGGFDLSAISLAATYLGAYNSDTNAFADLDVVIWMQGGTLMRLSSGNINAKANSITVHMSGGTLAGTGANSYAIMANTIYISGGQIAGNLTTAATLYLSGSPSVGTRATGIEVAQNQFFYIDGALSGASVNVVPQADFDDGTVIAQAADSYTITEGDIEQLHLIGDYAADKEFYLENNQVKIRTVTPPALSGDGTADSPYEIADADDLMVFADLVNSGNTGIYAILTDDVDMSGKTWTGIALTEAAPYTGTFDGQGHTISNLTGTEGLFAYNNGTVQNVRAENANITREGGNLAVIAGVNAGTVSGCVTSGSVSGTGDSSWSIGGIAGWNNGGTVSGCISSCTVSSEAIRNQTAGGLVGSNSGGGTIISSIYIGTAAKPVEGDNAHGIKTNVYYKDTTGAWHKLDGTATTDSTINEAAAAFNEYVDENGGYFVLSQEGEILSAALSGNGTTDDPYLIYTADQLRQFARIVNGTLTDDDIEGGYKADSAACGRLMENIDLNPGFIFDENGYAGGASPQQWTPMGSKEAPYTGTFDGGGKTISGLYIEGESTSDIGLFCRVGAGGTVKNLGIVNSYLHSDSMELKIGSIVGRLDSGFIENCYNEAAVRGALSQVGGIAGVLYGGSITNCCNAGNVSGAMSAGGIAGEAYDSNGVGSTIESCCNTGSITLQFNALIEAQYIGGIIAAQSATELSNCYNTGAVSVPETESATIVAGGITGWLSSGSITSCYNVGAVSAAAYSGGVAGAAQDTETQISNTYYLTDTAEKGVGMGSGDAAAITLADIENAGTDGLLAKLRQAEADAWNTELSAVGEWEYGKPAAQPVLSWQNVIENAPAYTVTIPETVTVDESETFIVTATVSAMAAEKQVQVAVDGSQIFELTLDDDSSVKLPYTLKNGENTIAAGGTVLNTGNTAEDAPVSVTLTIEPGAAKYSGIYTGTITFTVGVGDAA